MHHFFPLFHNLQNGTYDPLILPERDECGAQHQNSRRRKQASCQCPPFLCLELSISAALHRNLGCDGVGEMRTHGRLKSELVEKDRKIQAQAVEIAKLQGLKATAKYTRRVALNL